MVVAERCVDPDGNLFAANPRRIPNAAISASRVRRIRRHRWRCSCRMATWLLLETALHAAARRRHAHPRIEGHSIRAGALIDGRVSTRQTRTTRSTHGSIDLVAVGRGVAARLVLALACRTKPVDPSSDVLYLEFVLLDE